MHGAQAPTCRDAAPAPGRGAPPARRASIAVLVLALLLATSLAGCYRLAEPPEAVVVGPQPGAGDAGPFQYNITADGIRITCGCSGESGAFAFRFPMPDEAPQGRWVVNDHGGGRVDLELLDEAGSSVQTGEAHGDLAVSANTEPGVPGTWNLTLELSGFAASMELTFLA